MGANARAASIENQRLEKDGTKELLRVARRADGNEN